jgi:hypothetical protein
MSLFAKDAHELVTLVIACKPVVSRLTLYVIVAYRNAAKLYQYYLKHNPYAQIAMLSSLRSSSRNETKFFL